MSVVDLKKFGLNLSGRPLGIQAFGIIVKNYSAPFELDFSEVFSVGSSFADEVVAKLAAINGGSISIINSNRIINKCLQGVAQEKKFELIFK